MKAAANSRAAASALLAAWLLSAGGASAAVLLDGSVSHRGESSRLPLLLKRVPPPDVQPVVVAGVEYSAPTTDPGWVVAKRDGREIWRAQIYQIAIDPNLERDVQEIFIASLRAGDGRLHVADERGRHFQLNLTTHEVAPEKTP